MDKELLLNKVKVHLMKNPKFTFFTTILFSLKIEWTDEVPMIAVSSKKLFINPSYWITRSIEGGAADIMHEIMHIALYHLVRNKGKDPIKYNIAGDYVINLMLIDMGLHLDNTFLLDAQYKGMSTEEVYNKLPDNNLPKCNQDIQPSDGEDNQDIEEIEQNIKNILSNAKVQSELNNSLGTLPNAIKRELDELLDPVLDWKTLLFNYVSAKAKEDYSFKKRNKKYRDIFIPSLYSEEFGDITCICDCSGSINKEQYHAFLSEIQGISEILNPSNINIINFGSTVGSVVSVPKYENILDYIELEQLGGTRILPALEKSTEFDSEILVIITDGRLMDNYKSFTPKSDVLWVIIDNPSFNVNYGEVIEYKENN